MASSYTYPVARPEGTLTTAQIHALLARPQVIAKRIQTLVQQKFLADYLLTGRFTAAGGGIFYETGEEIFPADAPRAISPGGEYPLTVLTRGELAAAKTVKWGLDTEIYDEAIARMGQNPVDRALAKLANGVVRHVDQVAWGVIASKVTSTYASAAWSSVANIVTALLTAQAQRAAVDPGINLDTVVLTGTRYATVMGSFVNAGVLPREQGNVIVSGNLPANLLGFNWVTSPNITGSDVWLVDRDLLGGMADEDLGSPGYVAARADGAVGIEVKVPRLTGDDDRDGYRPRARRVTVPVVLEPLAGVKITGTGL
jgi:hypothetical protein